MASHSSTNRGGFTASTAPEWLAYLKREPHDSSWLLRYEGNVFEAVRTGLSKNFYFHDAVELLMMVFPFYALVCGGIRHWWPLLFDALADAQTLRDSAMQIQILTRLGESYLVFGKHAEAQNVFALAVERAREKQMDEMMLAAYIGLIKVQTTQISDYLNNQVINHALSLAKGVNNLALKAMLYQTLGMMYTYHNETVLAFGYGQTAYVLWHHLRNELEMGRTAIVLTQAARVAFRFELSATFLERAQQHLAKTELARQEAQTAYEKGCLYLEKQDYVEAQQWLELALQEFVSLGLENQIAGARHALGLAQVELHLYDEARTNLKAALGIWQNLKYWHEQVNVLYALGYLAFRLRDWENAREAWEQADGLCDNIPQNPLRFALEMQIKKALIELRDFRPDSNAQAGNA